LMLDAAGLQLEQRGERDMHPSILLHPEPLALLCYTLGSTQLTYSHLASLLISVDLC
jgi:hypothetical protein